MFKKCLATLFCGSLVCSMFALSINADARQSAGPDFVIDRLPADLSGVWEFAFAGANSTAPPVEAAAWRPIRVPGTWQESGYSGHGIAWLRARILIEPSAAASALAFASIQIRDADEVFIDQVRIGATGGFPPAYQKGTMTARVYELPPALTARPGLHALTVKVYNAGPRGGGITGAPRIDRLAAAVAWRSRRDLGRISLASAIGAIGLAVLVFYLRDRGEPQFLFFVLYATSVSADQLTWLSSWSQSYWPLSWQFRLNFFFIFITLAFCLIFNLKSFGRALQRRHIAILAAIGILSGLTLLWPSVDDLYRFLAADEVILVIVVSEMIWNLVRDTRRRIPYAAPVLAGTLLCALGAAHDIMQDFGLIGSPAGASRLFQAVLIFTIIYLWVMADRFARANVEASTDWLTGLPNRKLLFERLSQELARSARSGAPCGLAILDLDNFKSFNDKFGHLAGDQLLRVVASAIKASVRETDLVARYGGEEFVVVLGEVLGPKRKFPSKGFETPSAGPASNPTPNRVRHQSGQWSSIPSGSLPSR